jgi:tRNA 5-methylaminomethyl-2-thiouridine biosynthesis bifunctional protein
LSGSNKPALSGTTVSTAQLQWDEQGQPLATEFDDVYFSRHNGLEETRYVFLQHNDLDSRWRPLQHNADFVIAETGFGTGLNFLAAWQLWSQSAPSDARLHFISVEMYPLTKPDLQRALALWPELAPLAEPLLQQYPDLLHPGFHHLSFADGNVRLTLIIDEAVSGFQQLLQSQHPAWRAPIRPVDAWFLDGFAPAKNPAMWRDELFEIMQALSSPGTTAATFTAAGVVKRGLKHHGFALEKVKGFGHKREMLRARLAQPQELPRADDFDQHAHNSPHPVPWPVNKGLNGSVDSSIHSAGHALVIGAGIAGCLTAAALARRNWRVTIVERNTGAAMEGSGNPQGVVYAKLSHRSETLSDFNLQALLFAQRCYQPLWQQALITGQQCGVLQLAHGDKVADNQYRLWQHYQQQNSEQTLFQHLDPAQASAVSGVEQHFGGLFFPAAGWLSPASLCERLLEHPNITMLTETAIEEITRNETRDSEQWQAMGRERQIIASADVVIGCGASELRQLQQTRFLPLKPIRGQVTYLQATDTSNLLKTVICGEGYLPPAFKGEHCLGATFDPRRLELALREEDHQHNLDSLAGQIPSLAGELCQSPVTGGRAALRCTTPDYLPLTGPVPIQEDYLSQYALLRKNARSSIAEAANNQANLYVNAGFGSRGLAYAPLCAELLAAQISGEPLPVSQATATALHPGRFVIRDLIRGKV